MMAQECYSGPLWHIAYVEPRAEKDVCADIAKDLGYGVFLPMERFRIHPACKPISRPLFQRYVPVQVDPYRQDWQEVLDVDGVIDVLRMPGSDAPGHVSAAKIEALMKAEACGLFDRTTKWPTHFELDELVRVSDGPFAGLNATIVEFIHKLRAATATKRAKVLIAFMGQMTTIDLPVTSLEKL
jgi:transcription antitermination factor NusG